MRFSSAVFPMLCLAAACAAPKQDDLPVDPGKAAYEIMSSKSMIVGKPALVRMGLRPLSLEEARPYMNALFAALGPDLEKTNITYQMAGNDIILTIQAHLILDSGGSFQSDMLPRLDGLAAALVKYDRSFVEFRGHTSSAGDKGVNLSKSKLESMTVADYFMKKGVFPARVFINGQGESMWIADNSTREGRLLNHRIEIRISPLI